MKELGANQMSCFQICRLRSSSEIHLSPKYISVMGTAISCTFVIEQDLIFSKKLRSMCHDITYCQHLRFRL